MKCRGVSLNLRLDQLTALHWNHEVLAASQNFQLQSAAPFFDREMTSTNIQGSTHFLWEIVSWCTNKNRKLEKDLLQDCLSQETGNGT